MLSRNSVANNSLTCDISPTITLLTAAFPIAPACDKNLAILIAPSFRAYVCTCLMSFNHFLAIFSYNSKIFLARFCLKYLFANFLNL